MTVTVYSKKRCQPCRLTKKKLEEAGIAYVAVDIEEDAEAKAYVDRLGYTSAPVVVVDFGDEADWTWSGITRLSHNIEKLKEIA